MNHSHKEIFKNYYSYLTKIYQKKKIQVYELIGLWQKNSLDKGL